MLIEDEVPKNYFRNSSHKLLVNILFTSNWITEKMKHMLEVEDLTTQQYNILRILQISETPLSTLKIRERMLDKMSDTSRIVERLLKKELVHKKVSRHDKRLVDVTLTDKGKEMIERLDRRTGEIDAIASNLTSDEINSLNDCLDKMRDTKG